MGHRWGVPRGRKGQFFPFWATVVGCAVLATGIARADVLPDDACRGEAHEGDFCGNAEPLNLTPGTCQNQLFDRQLSNGQVAYGTRLICVAGPSAHGGVLRYVLVGSGMFAVGLGALVVARRRKR